MIGKIKKTLIPRRCERTGKWTRERICVLDACYNPVWIDVKFWNFMTSLWVDLQNKAMMQQIELAPFVSATPPQPNPSLPDEKPSAFN